jgi:DNA polymerase
MDEQLRRYYLDQLRIQCWQAVARAEHESPHADADQPVLAPELAPVLTPALKLEQAVQQCTACVLHEKSAMALAGRGAADADVLVLLISPSVEDEHAGQLCSGEQGVLLDKMLAAIGLTGDQVYVTSLLKHSVPDQHTITPAEVDACRQFLDQQLASVRPRFILMLGDLVTRCFFQQDNALDAFREDINDNQESALAHYSDARLLVSYSPQELLQNPADKRKAWQDLQQLQALI